MSPLLLALQLSDSDDNLGGLILFVLFVVLPILGRFLRWLGQRAGLVRPEEQAGEDPREALRRRRAEREAAEAEGEDLWRRLARGETLEAPRPVAVPSEPREASLEWELETEPGEVHAESLEREEEPAPIASLGEVREAAPVRELSLETEEAPLPLGAFVTAALDVQSAVPVHETKAPGRGPGRRLGSMAREDWRRAIVLSEVLGPPVSERQSA
ncbi:MAG TPA: hypothetical protein VF530_07785 [Planctomycetota bacterium]